MIPKRGEQFLVRMISIQIKSLQDLYLSKMINLPDLIANDFFKKTISKSCIYCAQTIGIPKGRKAC